MEEPRRNKIIIFTNSILTKAVYIIYPVLIAYLALEYMTDKEPGLVPALVVPGVSFIAVSIFRAVYNAPRPYEGPEGKRPVIKKDSPGKSFPSRHIFSVFIIAVAVFKVWPPVGILTGLAGVALAAVRVAGGVHFVRDVVAGALIGLFLGIMGFYFIMPF